MAQIFYWDEWQIKREEQIRLKALNQFPWSQLKKIKEDFVDPFTHYWPELRKIMLLELVYRMVFESYAAGMIERKKAGRRKVTFSQPVDAASRLPKQPTGAENDFSVRIALPDRHPKRPGGCFYHQPRKNMPPIDGSTGEGIFHLPVVG